MAIEWTPHQIFGLQRTEFEVGAIGGKGGGKSTLLRGAMVKGNIHLPAFLDTRTGQKVYAPNQFTKPILLNHYYVYHPRFAGLILRFSQKDLEHFIQEAIKFWAPLGAEYITGKNVFRFPDAEGNPQAGGSIYCGHLGTDDAWQKYLGNEYQKIGIEECGLIREERQYEQVVSCLRTSSPELLCQIYVTSNFVGPGAGWLEDRFCHKPDRYGNTPGKNTPHEHEYTDPETNEKFTRSRIWLFSTYKDNPHIGDYKVTLMMQTDERLRRIYMLGEPDRGGKYFSTFRLKPNEGEPANAQHVISPDQVKLDPWLPCFGSLDIGFTHKAAAYWARYTPNRRIYVTQEWAKDRQDHFNIGAEIARRTLPILDHPLYHGNVVFFISHDAFAIRGDRQPIELIMQGAARVLGKERVHSPLWDLNQWREQGQELPSYAAQQQYLTQLRESAHKQKHNSLVFERANPDRVIGFTFLRELLRWEDVIGAHGEYDLNTARLLLTHDLNLWRQYMAYHQNKHLVQLPKLQILLGIPDSPIPGCPELVKALPKARHAEKGNPEDVDKTHFDGMDSIDSLRYLAIGYRDFLSETPIEAYYDKVKGLFAEGDARFYQQGPDLVARMMEEDRGQVHGVGGIPLGGLSNLVI